MFRLPRLENRCDMLVLCLLVLALQQLAGAAMIKAKAWLAPLLIEQAWQESLLRDGTPVKPWPWADTWPVARLRAPGQGVDLLVLAGDSGNALAFGPGHARASAPLGSAGLAVVGGHRDTHFAFLRQLQGDEVLQLHLPDGELRRYRVAARRVVNADRESLSATAAGEALLLVTCYPFDALLADGPLRYAVRALPVSSPDLASGQPSTSAEIYAL